MAHHASTTFQIHKLRSTQKKTCDCDIYWYSIKMSANKDASKNTNCSKKNIRH